MCLKRGQSYGVLLFVGLCSVLVIHCCSDCLHPLPFCLLISLTLQVDIYVDVTKGLLPVLGVNATAVLEQPLTGVGNIIIPLLDTGVGEYCYQLYQCEYTQTMLSTSSDTSVT